MMFARAVVITALFAGVPASVALAQTVAEFYRGKSIELGINVSVGGGYDLYARMVARHIGKHIPGNPTILPKNMEGRRRHARRSWARGGVARDLDSTSIAVHRVNYARDLIGSKNEAEPTPISVWQLCRNGYGHRHWRRG
jgi:hypothetical protein